MWPQIAAALDALRAENDVVVIEGAGSPAEINLHASDIVNMRVARHADARCLLVTDIDRGGAFAHLYGTWALLPEDERALIQGFVLNKFRGDASLLAPAPQMLQDLTGVPTVATIPMQWRHGLPEEDGVFDDRTLSAGAVHTTVAVIAYPRISNLDEFQPLKNVPGVRLIWARSPADLAGLKPPTGWCCRAPSPPLPTWPGCARKGLTRPLPITRGRAARCWACVAACRCWARH